MESLDKSTEVKLGLAILKVETLLDLASLRGVDLHKCEVWLKRVEDLDASECTAKDRLMFYDTLYGVIHEVLYAPIVPSRGR